jgi:hypothetical protein
MENVYFMAHPSGWDIKYTFSLYYLRCKTRFDGVGLDETRPPPRKKKNSRVTKKKLTHARQRENGRPSESRDRRGVVCRRGVDGTAFRVGVGGGATKSTDFVETHPDTG